MPYSPEDSGSTSPEQEQSHSKRVIRFHRKSRAGCLSCKKRRVKCDEVHPICTHCARRDVECIWVRVPYTHSASAQRCDVAKYSPSPPPRPPLAAAAPRYVQPTTPNPLNINSMRLIHHYTVSTSSFILSNPMCVEACRMAIPELAFHHPSPFLLNMLLAISALHLDTVYPNGADMNHSQLALQHKNCGLTLLPHPSQILTSDSNFIGVAFYTIYLIASSTVKGTNESLFSLITMLHKIYKSDQMYYFRGRALQALDYGHLLYQLPTPPDNPFPSHLLSLHLPHTAYPPYPSPSPEDDLELSDPEISAAYQSSVQALQIAWPFCDSGYELVGVVKWPEFFGETFVTLLSERRPRALVIMYYWCTLLHRMSYCWWLGNTMERMVYVRSLLDERWQQWLDSIPNQSPISMIQEMGAEQVL